MASEPQANRRIDAGIKRGPRVKPSDMEREVRERARQTNGTFLPVHTPEQRRAVLDDALQCLQQGLTTDDIAKKHGVSGQAVRTWLVAAGEEYSMARTIFYARMQVGYLEQIESANDPLALARGREGFSGWHKLAQVRDPKNFGPSQQISVKNEPLSDKDAGLLQSAQELLALFKAKAEKVVNPPQIEVSNAPLSDSDHLTD